MTFRFHAEARTEYRQTVLYYARRSPRLGTEFATRLEQALASVRQHPFARRRLDETGARQALLRQFPYKLVYVIEQDASQRQTIAIYAVAHVKRKPGYWSGRLADEDDDLQP